MSINHEEIAKLFLDWLEGNVPRGTAVAFAFGSDATQVMCVVGGQNIYSPTFDRLILKLAGQIDEQREDQEHVRATYDIKQKDE